MNNDAQQDMTSFDLISLFAGISKPKLFLNLSTLVQGEWYTIVALTSTPGSPNSTSSLTFLLNKLASSGTCSIEPRTGIELYAKYILVNANLTHNSSVAHVIP